MNLLAVLFVLTVITVQSSNAASSSCATNEEFTTCGTACPPNCKDLNPSACTLQCVRGCFCNQGYVKDKNGKCVLPSDCPTCPGSNEHYACGSACDNECDKLGQPCPIVNIKCNDRCYCNQGYARNSYGTCVPEYEC